MKKFTSLQMQLLFVLLFFSVSMSNAQVIGHDGSWGDNPTTTIAAGVDGDINTFIDAPQSQSYVGYDLGEGKIASVTKIRYVPRSTHPVRMVGNQIRVSNNPSFLTDYETVCAITTEPPVGVYTEATFSVTNSYRYIYLYSSNSCNLAEIEFYGTMDGATAINAAASLSEFTVASSNGRIIIDSHVGSILDIYNTYGQIVKSKEIESGEATFLCNPVLYIIKDRKSCEVKKLL